MDNDFHLEKKVIGPPPKTSRRGTNKAIGRQVPVFGFLLPMGAAIAWRGTGKSDDDLARLLAFFVVVVVAVVAVAGSRRPLASKNEPVKNRRR